VRILNIRPDISSIDLNAPIQSNVDSVQIDSQQYANKLDIDLGNMKSGETRQIFMNFSSADQVIFSPQIKKHMVFRMATYAICHLCVCQAIICWTVIRVDDFMFESKYKHLVS
jgi:hypothetical protein